MNWHCSVVGRQLSICGKRVGWWQRGENRPETIHAQRRLAGFSLLELLVVLIILAVVATLAVNSLQPRIESTRFDQTRAQLKNLEQAIVGQRGLRQTDDTLLISGFLADIGRLPSAIRPGLADNPAQEMSELWDIDSRLATEFPFRFRSGPSVPVDYSDVQLPCGWRGPYLQLPMGTNTLTDAWGRPFSFELNERGQIDRVIWQPTGNIDTPLTSDLTTGTVIVTGAIDFGQSEPSSVDVVLLTPNPDSSLSELQVLADEDDNAATFVFTNVPVGLRAIHIRINGRQMIRYLQVPHQGLSLVIDASANNPGVGQSAVTANNLPNDLQ